MAIELTTGVPGAGKTLYTVSEVLRPLAASTVEIEGRAVPRRLCIAGIPDLLIAHELVEAKQVPPEGYTDPWGDLIRRPGEPPVTWAKQQTLQEGRDSFTRWIACFEGDAEAQPVPRLVENWWLWVMPGDVLVIDECQTVFRPMPSGRRAPAFIRQLEVHRHYGIDLVLITQHPQLLHAAVRALVGQHRHVRRLFGRRAALVYEWDHCSPPERVKTATTKVWPYKKSAFGLYKSSQLHTKQRWGTSWPMVLGLCAVLALPFLWWRALSGTAHKGAEMAASAAASAPAGVVGVAPPAAGQASAGAPVPKTGPAWPVMETEPQRIDREPYAGRGFQIEGGYEVDGQAVAYFGLVQDGVRIATVTLAQLVRAGYAYTSYGPCAGLLRFGDRERVLSCGPRGEPPAPQQPASAPVT